MISVGVRDLKNQLSQYLQFVKKGERVIITEHNKIIAELSLPRNEPHDLPVAEALQRLSARGKVVLAQRNISLAPIPETSGAFDWKEIYERSREGRD